MIKAEAINILAIIIEKVTGLPYEEFLSKELLDNSMNHLKDIIF